MTFNFLILDFNLSKLLSIHTPYLLNLELVLSDQTFTNLIITETNLTACLK